VEPMLNACNVSVFRKLIKKKKWCILVLRIVPSPAWRFLQQHVTSAVRILCHWKAVKVSLAKDCRQHVANVGDKIKWVLAAG
jgi:hypothetical protein